MGASLFLQLCGSKFPIKPSFGSSGKNRKHHETSNQKEFDKTVNTTRRLKYSKHFLRVHNVFIKIKKRKFNSKFIIQHRLGDSKFFLNFTTL